MAIPVVVDTQSGFCFGVKRAVETAEAHLKQGHGLCSLGHIVHNTQEVDRLRAQGLTPLKSSELSKATKQTVLFRAHGEPPSTYQKAAEMGIEVIDATCPVVLKLQQRVKKAWEAMKPINGQVVLYGKKNHPEVIGLLGQTNNEAILVESVGDLSSIDLTRPIELFCQTTKSIEGFQELTTAINQQLKAGAYFVPHDTICRQVSGRVPRIREFAQQHSTIVFVGGAESSNAKVLFEHCKQVNPNSFFINQVGQVTTEWFANKPASVGVCGATSTPQWQLEQVANAINNLLNDATA
jgi:4-hydroxy-3-methylbut-2-en-1-yl diphosphate reductase